MAAMGAMMDAAEVVEESGPATYTMQGTGGSVWGEITGAFGQGNYAAIREANADLTDKEWRRLKAGDEILLPNGIE